MRAHLPQCCSGTRGVRMRGETQRTLRRISSSSTARVPFPPSTIRIECVEYVRAPPVRAIGLSGRGGGVGWGGVRGALSPPDCTRHPSSLREVARGILAARSSIVDGGVLLHSPQFCTFPFPTPTQCVAPCASRTSTRLFAAFPTHRVLTSQEYGVEFDRVTCVTWCACACVAVEGGAEQRAKGAGEGRRPSRQSGVI